jgi:hypothetical protein
MGKKNNKLSKIGCQQIFLELQKQELRTIKSPLDCTNYYLPPNEDPDDNWLSCYQKALKERANKKANPIPMSKDELSTKYVLQGLFQKYPNLVKISVNEKNLLDYRLGIFFEDGRIQYFDAYYIHRALFSLAGMTNAKKKEEFAKDYIDSMHTHVSADDIYPIIPNDESKFLYIKKLPKPASSPTPAWDSFLSHMDYPDIFKLWIGSLLDYKSSRQQYMVMYGEGGEGKSDCMNALCEVFKETSTTIRFDTSVPPRVEKMEFKRLTMVTDTNNSSASFFDSGIFKTLTGDERADVNEKFKTPRDVLLKTKFMIATNKPPKILDTAANTRRFLCVKLTPPSMKERLDNPDWTDHLKEQAENFVSDCYEFYKKESETNPLLKKGISSPSESIDSAIAENLSENVYVNSIEVFYKKEKGVYTLITEVYQKLGADNDCFKQNKIKEALAALGYEIEMNGKKEDGKRDFRKKVKDMKPNWIGD